MIKVRGRDAQTVGRKESVKQFFQRLEEALSWSQILVDTFEREDRNHSTVLATLLNSSRCSQIK